MLLVCQLWIADFKQYSLFLISLTALFEQSARKWQELVHVYQALEVYLLRIAFLNTIRWLKKGRDLLGN